MNVTRHSVDPELVAEGVDSKRTLLTTLIGSATTRPTAYSLVLGTACAYAGYLSVARPDSDELCESLRIGTAAAASIFTPAAQAGAGASAQPALTATDATHAGNWRLGWWLAHIARDRVAIDRLAVTPVQVLRQSSTRGDECQYLFIDALQAFERQADDWSTKLRQAVDATDPQQVDISDEEFVLNIIVTEMEMVFRLAAGDTSQFNEALHYALERHKKYWAKASRKRDPLGLLAFGPLAIAAMAYDAGITCGVASEYLPMRLIEGGCRGVQG